MTAIEKLRQVAIIRESECIGCTKCIQACPVDAILGSRKQMHTVIIDECISCKLCIPPCPVDCIEMVESTTDKPDAMAVRSRNQARKIRVGLQTELPAQMSAPISDKQRYIMEAVLRAKKIK